MKMKKILLFISLILMINGCGDGTKNSGTSSIFNASDVVPKIDAKENYEIPENRKKAFDIKAKDKSLLKYFIAGKDAPLMHADVLTGEVIFLEPTNHDKKSLYEITVVADDNFHRVEKNVTITILKTGVNSNIDVVNKDESFDENQTELAFITMWKTDNNGTSANNQITIPTLGDDYNYSVDWGDGKVSQEITGDITHTYENIGTYKVKILGNFPRLAFSRYHDKSDAKKLLSIEQWGKIEWLSMAGAFDGCENLVSNARDIPNLSKVSNMEYMFLGATKFNSDISRWDVSNVTNMLCIFGASSSFNQDINSWDVSKVTNMVGAFFGAGAFNQPLDNWDVSSVTDMNSMFFQAGSFNQDISDWDVANVKILDNFLFKATSFNQDLENWDIVSNEVSMKNAFTDTNLTKLPSWNR